MLTRARTKAQAQAQLSADVSVSNSVNLSVSISANLRTLHIRYGLDDLKPPKLPLHLESLIIERDLPEHDLPDLHMRTLLTQLISLHAIATVRIEGYMLLFGPNASASASASESSVPMDALRQDKRLMRQLMRKTSLQTLALSVMGDDMGRMVDELLRTARGGQPMCRCPPVMELRFCKERDFDGDRTWLKRVDVSTMTGMAAMAATATATATAIRPSLDLTLGSVMCADSDVWQPLQQPLPQLDLTLEDCMLLIGHVGHAGHDGVLEYLASIPEGKLHLRNVWVQLGPRAHIEGAAAAADGTARAYWDLLEKVLVNGSVG